MLNAVTSFKSKKKYVLSCISVLIQLFYYIRTFVQQFLGIADTCINKNNKSLIMRKL